MRHRSCIGKDGKLICDAYNTNEVCFDIFYALAIGNVSNIAKKYKQSSFNYCKSNFCYFILVVATTSGLNQEK